MGFYGNEGKGLTKTEPKVTTPPRFYGTSAAAPNVAAVGLILLQACKLYSNNNPRRLLLQLEDDDNEDRKDTDDARRRVRNRRKLKSDSKSKRSKTKESKSSKSKSSKSKRPQPQPFDCTKPAMIYKILETTAIDMQAPGYDFVTGYGFVNAVAAVDKLLALLQDPVAAAVFAGTIDAEDSSYYYHEDNDEQEEQQHYCPIDNFLFPITNSFNAAYVNPTMSPTSAPSDSPTQAPTVTPQPSTSNPPTSAPVVPVY